MAKVKSLLPSDKKDYSYPSRFGSHSSMINEEATGKLNDPKRVVLEDEFGLYETDRNRLDTGAADPNRYVQSRIGRLLEK